MNSDWKQQIEGVGTSSEAAQRLVRDWRERGLGGRGRGGPGWAARDAGVVVAALEQVSERVLGDLLRWGREVGESPDLHKS